jgi:hypothetical protein
LKSTFNIKNSRAAQLVLHGYDVTEDLSATLGIQEVIVRKRMSLKYLCNLSFKNMVHNISKQLP